MQWVSWACRLHENLIWICLEADWFCAKCNLKQKVSTQKITFISSHSLVKQSQSESKKQAIESTNAESLLQRDSSLMTLEGAKGAIGADSQHTDVFHAF